MSLDFGQWAEHAARQALRRKLATMTEESPEDYERYCSNCGDELPSAASYCGSCGRAWLETTFTEGSAPTGPNRLVASLTDLQHWHQAGGISTAAYADVREYLRGRLELVRQPTVVTVAPDAAPQAIVRAPTPQFDFGQWAADRQADILLYVGAFFLVVAAVLFMSYQGRAVQPAARVGLFSVYTLVFIAAGLMVRRWERVREAGPVFLALGALLTPLNFVLLYTEVLHSAGVSREVIWLWGSVACAALYGALYLRGHGSLYRVPAGIAAVNAWEATFVTLGLPRPWIPAWNMGGAASVAVAAATLRRFPNSLVGVVTTTSALALFAAHAAAAARHDYAEQLPVTYWLLTVSLIAMWWARRWSPLIPLAATVLAGGVIASEWAIGLGPEWFCYPILVLGASTLATRQWWAMRSSWLAHFGWLFAAGCGASPLLMTAQFSATGTSAHAAVSHLLGAAILGAVAWRDRDHGVARWGTPTDAETGSDGEVATPGGERILFGWGALVLLLPAVAYAHKALGVTPPNTSWAFLVLSAALASAFIWRARRWEAATLALGVPFLVTFAAALQPWFMFPGHDALLLAIAAAELLACAIWVRGARIAVFAGIFGGASLAGVWTAQDWPTWELALTYDAAASVFFIACALWPPSAASRSGASFALSAMKFLSWVFVLGAFGAGCLALADHVIHFPFSSTGVPIGKWFEYRALVLLLALLVAQFLIEALRERKPGRTIPAAFVTVIALAAAWPIAGWTLTTLAVTYDVIGTVLLLVLMTRRSYPNTDAERTRWSDAAAALPWTFVVAALGSMLIGVAGSLDDGPVVRSGEYRTFVILVLIAGAQLAFDGIRLRIVGLSLAASVVAMVGVLLAIAIAEPQSEQAYTVPTALYLFAAGLIAGRRAAVSSDHVHGHEFALIAGALVLLLPQAERGFEPDGAWWGFVLLGEAAVLLVIGLLLHERWFAVAGVLTSSVVGIRWLAVSGDTIPYWLTLGVGGLLLLGLGVLMLFQREWWDRTRRSLGAWWHASPQDDDRVLSRPVGK